MPDIVFTVVLPLLAIVLFAVLGYMRGAARETFVSGAIALSALIAFQWGEPWGRDLAGIFSGVGAGTARFYVTLAMMALGVLVLGYGLGSSLVKGKPTSTSRGLGLLLGLLNGAAASGWLLLTAWQQLDASSASSPAYSNPISYALMVMAGWSPIILAALGAVGRYR